MVDYNDVLSVEEKIECMLNAIETEKEKVAEILKDNRDPNRRLGALEEYYLSIKEINQKYGVPAASDPIAAAY